MSACYRGYKLIYTSYGVSLYGINGFIQNFSTEDEAIEYINDNH